MFKKILIANRGEIACRIIDTARRMGVATVAVYSDADRNSLHVTLADEAVYIGAAPARESYLLGEKILAAAQITDAEAIHPGYGFLSENADFAAASADQGVVFIGPGVAAIAAMGSKSAAKRIMEQAGVPLVPGYHGDNQDPAQLKSAAQSMGYPVLLKATAGGGGKGMRQVWSAEEFDEALAAAKRESLASFSDDTMLVEKYLIKPRHVEFQIFFDHHGHGIYLAERDCSVQRRHQKIIEEAPAPGMTDTLRKAMGETAVAAARAIDYRGAGTVEFLLQEDGSFYFMEMNTRLQVEHPVTEMITGLDLVEWQLLVACGAPLPLTQEAVKIHGHAFEARVYAEDPDNDFLPVTGTLGFLRMPEESRYVRVDTGVCQGDHISVYYDPMIAKLIVWDESRDRALRRLCDALSEYRISGAVTNLDFLYNLATCRPFEDAQLNTGFIDEHKNLLFQTHNGNPVRELPLAALALLLHKQRQAKRVISCLDPYSPWQDNNAWRLNEPHNHRITLHWQQQDYTVELEQRGEQYSVRALGHETLLAGTLEDDTLHFENAGHRQCATLAHTHDRFTLYLPEGACHFHEVFADTGETEGADSDGGLRAPMNGTVVTLLAQKGDQVDTGAPLLVMEAMKMEHTIRAPCRGIVQAFYYQSGDLVDGGATLVDFIVSED